MADIFDDFANLLGFTCLSDVHFQKDQKTIKEAILKLKQSGKYQEEDLEKLKNYINKK